MLPQQGWHMVTQQKHTNQREKNILSDNSWIVALAYEKTMIKKNGKISLLDQMHTF